MKKITYLAIGASCISIASLMALSSCGKKSSDAPAAAASSTTTTSNFSSAYPLGLAFASPTAQTTASRALTAKGVTAGRFATSSDSSYEDKAAETTAMVTSSDSIDDCDFNPTFSLTSANASCYGPTLNYVNFPGGGGGSGQLPSGDLGIWTETETGTTEACAAAQLNKKVSNIAGQIDSAINMTASLYCIARVNHLTLPSIGGTLDMTSSVVSAYTTNSVPLTVSSASITRAADTADAHPVYVISLAGTDGTNSIELRLKHISTNTDNSTYKGKLSFTVSNSTSGGGNCGSAAGQTMATSIAYEKDSATALSYELNSGSFCGSSAAPFVSSTNYTVDKTAIYNSSTNTDGWGNNFNYALFNYNPADSTGNFRFAWQAGANDSNTRVMNVSLSETSGTTSGAAYFGFGPSMTGGSVSDPVGGISKMICNWAGPGNSHTGVTKAQRQVLTKSSAATLFTATSSNITYAPVNSCDYTTGSNFQYSTATPSSDHASVTNDLYPIASITDLTAPTAPADVDL